MARKPRLRTGFTTGACATAAAKAAAELLLLGDKSRSVTITLPLGQVATFKPKSKRMKAGVAVASVIKDAGDDPDITNGAEIGAEVRVARRAKGITLFGGEGVGKVTRPGLPVKPGRPAINPVPRRMIRSSVAGVRRKEFDGYRAEAEGPDDRFETYGIACHRNLFKNWHYQESLPEDGILRGVGCCPGEVEGPVDARDLHRLQQLGQVRPVGPPGASGPGPHHLGEVQVHPRLDERDERAATHRPARRRRPAV